MTNSFNYLPDRSFVVPKEQLQAFAAYTGMLVYPALAIVLVIFAFGFEAFRVSTATKDRDNFAAREVSLSRQRAALLAVKDTDTEAIIPLLSQIADIRNSGERNADSIALLGQIRPAHVWLDTVQGSPGGAQTLIGGAPSLRAVSAYVTDIEKSLKRRATITLLTSTKGKRVYLGYTLNVAAGSQQ